jgi:hypothetical protein
MKSLVLITLLLAISGITEGKEGHDYHQGDLLTKLSSSDVDEVEEALYYIREKSITSPQVIRALIKLLEDPRPEIRVSRDVIGRSPSKNAYMALANITEFKPSQPSLLFEESKNELEQFVRTKYSKILTQKSSQDKNLESSSTAPTTKEKAALAAIQAKPSEQNPSAPLPHQSVEAIEVVKKPTTVIEETAEVVTVEPAEEAPGQWLLWLIGALIVLGCLGWWFVARTMHSN